MNALDRPVVIVGLGLMGSSLARAWQPYVSDLAGVDPDPTTRAAAGRLLPTVVADLAQLPLTPETLVVLATPVQTIVRLLARLPQLAPAGCQVLDIGSVKAPICAAMMELPPTFAALGGHPLCGRELSGWEAGRGDLFQGCPFVLCPTPRTTPALQQRVRALLAVLGANEVEVGAERHDAIVAVTSHLPYLAAAGLMRQAAQAATMEPLLYTVSAGGLRDTTRLAGSNPTMLADIVRANQAAIVAALRAYQGQLDALLRLLIEEDEAALHAWLTTTQALHQAYTRQRPPDL